MSSNPCPNKETPHCNCKDSKGVNITTASNPTDCIASGGEWSSYCYAVRDPKDCSPNETKLDCELTSDCRWDTTKSPSCYYYGTGCSAKPLICQKGKTCAGYCFNNPSLDYDTCMETIGGHWRIFCIGTDTCSNQTEDSCSTTNGCSWNGSTCTTNSSGCK